MGLAQNEEGLQALAAKGANDPLDKGVLPGRARGDEDFPNPIAWTRRPNSAP
jgi:hypothetical protein